MNRTEMYKIDYKWETVFVLLVVVLLLISNAACSLKEKAPAKVRVGLFNIWELSTEKLDEVDSLGHGLNKQLIAAADIIQKFNPDILIINEIDHDVDAWRSGESLDLTVKNFNERYLDKNKFETYKYYFAAPCNTGILAGMDLDNNGKVATAADHGTRDHGGDCFGYGAYPGQYSMAILSRFPINRDQVRTFQKYLWKDLPDNVLPDEWYSSEELEIFRLSSKSHWDVPVQIKDSALHLLVSHPTPPSFDGPEDRNGRRNYDEIKFWKLYLDNDSTLYDDLKQSGGLSEDKLFVLAGDLNASPSSDGVNGKIAINLLLDHPRINDCGEILVSEGPLMGRQPGPPEYLERRTIGWGKRGRRIDHLFPDKNIRVLSGGVFWPDSSKHPEAAALAKEASDHRFLWLDLEF